MYKHSVVCPVPVVIKALNITLMILWLLSMLGGQFGSNFFAWIVWFYLVIRLPLMFPDIAVNDEGVEVKRFFGANFLKWSDITSIRRGTIHARIYPEKIPFLIKLMVYDSFLLMFWNENFELAVQNIQDHLEESSP